MPVKLLIYANEILYFLFDIEIYKISRHELMRISFKVFTRLHSQSKLEFDV